MREPEFLDRRQIQESVPNIKLGKPFGVRKASSHFYQRTLKHNSIGKIPPKGSFFSLGLTSWCRKLKVWLLQTSTIDVNHASLACLFNWLNMSRASRRMGSSISSRGRGHVDTLWWGVGLGAGVGGEAGADGNGLGREGGGKVLMGVNGGLGCGLCAESLRRDVREPTATGAGGDLARLRGGISSPEEIGATCGWLLL